MVQPWATPLTVEAVLRASVVAGEREVILGIVGGNNDRIMEVPPPAFNVFDEFTGS